MQPNSAFCENYVEARQAFHEAAKSIGAILEAHTHPLKGPDGGNLTMDVAVVGEALAPSVLVLLSAVHGAEGCWGSAAQVSAMRSEALATGRLGKAIRVVLIHAVNPHGFAYRRRVNGTTST
jgi:hypothetical protein